MKRAMKRERLLGLLITVLPVAWMVWDAHHDPCGPQGTAWTHCAESR